MTRWRTAPCVRHRCGHDHEGHHDKFRRLHPDTDWETCVAYSEELGLGTRDYKLIRL